MPPKDLNRTAIPFILGPDGLKVQFSGIGELSGDTDKVEISTPFNSQDEYTHEFGIDLMKMIDVLYLITHGKLPPNNWRKMHRLPLRRKKLKKGR